MGKTKRIAKFNGLECQHCEDTKGIVAPEISPERFQDFRATGPRVEKDRAR